MQKLKRRDFMRKAAAVGLTLPVATGCTSFGAVGAQKVKGPNLLFVLVDQMRAHAQGFMGEDPVITPNLDRFSAESVVFDQAVSNAPVCSPYRGMLMTGKYPHANKVLSNCTSKTEPFNNELQESDRCWSDVLKAQGYSMGYIGKWHLEGPRRPFVKSYNNSEKFAWNEWTPPARRHGFDFWYAYNTFDMHNTPEYWSTDMTRDERVKVRQWGPEHETDLALKYMADQSGQYRAPGRPFSLLVSMNPPHTPYTQVPERYVERYADKKPEDLINRKNVLKGSPGEKMALGSLTHYFAMVTGIDDQFGRLLKGLKDLGLDRDTLVVFTSDHGNCVGCHNIPTKNNHYEESMRVPMMMRMPGKIPPRRDGLLMGAPDIAPTVMGLMGFASDIPSEMEGTNFAPLCQGKKMKRPTSQLYFKTQPDTPAHGERGVRTNRYTLMIKKTKGKDTVRVLFDNKKDPYQLHDIAEANPNIVEGLVEGELIPLLRKTKDPWLKS